MTRIFGAVAIASTLAGCAGSTFHDRNLENSNAVRVDPSPTPGADYVVTVRNLIDFGFDPDDKATRDGLALRMTRPSCATAQVVGETVIVTGQYGTGRPARTYSIRVKC